MYHVYFAKSLKNGKVYVGYTSKEPEKRVEEHNNSANEWTKNNKPFKLIYYVRYSCKEDAMNREKFYKTGFGKKVKHSIINSLGA